MITGAFKALAVYKTPLIVLEPTTLTAGKAKPFYFANLKIACTSFPVATPGFIL